MAEWYDAGDPFDDLERLVRAAKDYVRPSDELRPRVLEAARSQRWERRLQDGLRHLAALLVFLVMLAPALRQLASSGEPGVLATLPAEELLRIAEVPADAHWGLVDSIAELRRRQAEALHPAAQ